MSQPKKPTDLNKDDQLAEFTDQVLKGTINTASSSDEELLLLEETILRLKHVIPQNTPSEAMSKQMLVRLKARMDRESKSVRPSFWKQLFDFQANPQVGMILTAVAVLILVVIAAPFFSTTGPSLTGTASSSPNTLVIIGVAGVLLLLLFWLARRK